MTALVPVTANSLAVRDPWSVLPPLGSLDAYIGAVNRLPMLTLEQERDFAEKLKQNNDLEAAGALILSHLRLVVSVSRQYLGYGLPHADLIQEGNIGLMKAVRRFDAAHGVRLVSYALHWIKAEIHDYILKNWRMVKVATTKAQRKLFFNLRSMKQALQKTPMTWIPEPTGPRLTPTKSMLSRPTSTSSGRKSWRWKPASPVAMWCSTHHLGMTAKRPLGRSPI